VIPVATDQSVNGDFVHRLVNAHSSRSPELAAARRWHPGEIAVNLPTLIGPASPEPEQHPCFAMTAKLFAVWHQGRSAASQGFPPHGIGRWAHQLGVKDPKAERLISRIIAADNGNELTTALTALAASRTRRSPHWETVLTELLRWSDPAERAAIRFDWARDFYRYVPARSIATPQPAPNPTEEAV
jgi:hypothetical protein